MGGLFNMEGPVMSFLGRVADLIWLNVLAVLCCIPIVTAGASLTALHYMTVKMVRNEEGYITRGFFKSFRENFKQATIIWIILLALTALICGDLFIMNRMMTDLPKAFTIIIAAAGVVLGFTAIYIFPILSHFENTIKNTVKNAFLMSISNFPKTLLMLVIYILPVVIMAFVPAVFPIIVLLGVALPAYLASYLFSGIFRKFEPEESKDGFAMAEQES